MPFPGGSQPPAVFEMIAADVQPVYALAGALSLFAHPASALINGFCARPNERCS
jgi:hypothetical protein